MKYVITKEQRFFFEKNQFIEFDELISCSEAQSLLRGVKRQFSETLSDEAFLKGRDISRLDPEIQKTLFLPRLSQVAAELSFVRILRFGFDQLYVGQKSFSRLDEESCIQGISLALMLCLDGQDSETQDSVTQDSVTQDSVTQDSVRQVSVSLPSKHGIDPFPTKAGNGIFFLPSTICDPEALKKHQGRLFLLLVWTQERSLYILQPRDPHTHELKRLGYVFGDRLVDKFHPIMTR